MKYFTHKLVSLLFVILPMGSLTSFSGCDELVEKAKQLIIPDAGYQYNAEEERKKAQGINTESEKGKNTNITPLPVPKKGKLVFLTHGLEDNKGECFKTIVEEAEAESNKNGNYHNFDRVSVSYVLPKNTVQYINQLIDGGKNVLVRPIFSKGNLSFAKQLEEMEEIVEKFKGHNASDVVFVGHSMGGLASINYVVNNTTALRGKKITIITVSTPYQPNNYAKSVWGKDDIGGFTLSKVSQILSDQVRGEAHQDLGGFGTTLSDLRNKWNNYKGTAKLDAISVSMYSKLEPRWEAIGDGIVDIPAQQGDFLKNLANVGKWNGVNKREIIFGTGISTIGIDITTAVLSGKYFLLLFSDFGGINNKGNDYHHMNTSNLPDVIKEIKDIIDDRIK